MCTTHTNERACPDDGTPTIERRATTAGSEDIAEGRIIADRYRIRRTLGRGGFGAVYEAEHVATGQALALKVMRCDGADDPESGIRRFFQEARVTASLAHPNTVRVFDFGQCTDGVLYMAMEMLRGDTLQAELRRSAQAGVTIPQERAVEIGCAVLRSLAEAHAAGLVHRDVKPANIMLVELPDEGTAVKVLDFGIARAQDSSLTGDGHLLGTPYYMSPEQCRGLPLDGRSDLYAVGAILYQCATGRPPFVGSNPLSVMNQHVHERLEDPRLHTSQQLDDGFVAVVAQALEKRPQDRFADAREMRRALERVIRPGDEATPPAVVARVPLQAASTILLSPASLETPGVGPAAVAAKERRSPSATPVKRRLLLWSGMVCLTALVAALGVLGRSETEGEAPRRPARGPRTVPEAKPTSAHEQAPAESPDQLETPPVLKQTEGRQEAPDPTPPGSLPPSRFVGVAPTSAESSRPPSAPDARGRREEENSSASAAGRRTQGRPTAARLRTGAAPRPAVSHTKTRSDTQEGRLHEVDLTPPP